MSVPAIGLTGPAPITPPSTSSTKAGDVSTGGGSFADALTRLVDATDESSAQANEAVTGMLNKTGDVHDAMIALQRAEMSLQLTVQIRNKLVQAYQDIMRMPI